MRGIESIIKSKPVMHAGEFINTEIVNEDALKWLKKPPYMYTSLCPDRKYRPKYSQPK